MPVASEFTIDGLMAGIKEIIGKRHELMRNLSIFINIIAKFYDKVRISSCYEHALIKYSIE